jgi:hypothetical protein
LPSKHLVEWAAAGTLALLPIICHGTYLFHRHRTHLGINAFDYFQASADLRVAVQNHVAHEKRTLCSALTHFQVQANGDVVLCPFVPPVGNIKREQSARFGRIDLTYGNMDAAFQDREKQ